ncbi:MAG TPA: hypothetical protein VHY91_26360 [Pirellulales bacterium]|nr:hypothetical protein [Pirellulales bacterium]
MRRIAIASTVVALAGVYLADIHPSLGLTPPKPTADDDRIVDFDAVIDALANSNSPPRLIRGGRQRLALFPEDFDWAENKRVQELLLRLDGNKGDDL